MHGTEMAVAVPHEETSLKLMTPSLRDSRGLVARG